MPITISGPDDPRVEDYVGLTDVALRRRFEPEHGLFIAESEKVIRRALAAGHRPRSYLMAQRWLTDLADLVAAAEDSDVPVFTADHQVIESLTGFHLHRGALASMARLPLADLGSTVSRARRVMVLEDIVDHTNVGAIFRSAAGLGFDAVLVTPRCADPLYRRAIRVSMGTVFQVPWTRVDPWPASVDALRELGFEVVALALAEDSVPLDDYAGVAPDRVALVLGAEGDGLSRRTLHSVDRTVRIPMAGGVDSLNVAAAAAVAAWSLRMPRPAVLKDAVAEGVSPGSMTPALRGAGEVVGGDRPIEQGAREAR